jgi:CHASE2 domain-containing sensor protein/signal transduction histidine kinase
MKPHLLLPLVRRLAVREWFAMLAGMLLLAGLLGWQNGLGRLDLTLYDQFLSSTQRPARDDIIIVAIDDYSLSELGRWPWPRDLHAQIINHISNAKPRAIGLDIILSEPERVTANTKRTGDVALAQALKQNNNTVLPVIIANAGAGLSANLPIPELASTALSMGHIDLEHDSDGVVRSVFLNEGQSSVWWPHLALALYKVDHPTVSNDQLPGSKSEVRIKSDTNNLLGNWQRQNHLHIPFAGPSGHFRSIPYVSVLRGEVLNQFFADKYVLIGATAVGMTDSYPTPVSGETGAMAGIEINANILSSLLENKAITIASPWQTALFSMIPVLLAMLGYFALSPRLSLFMSGGLLLLTTAASYYGLRQGIWIAPSAALITLILSYPLWSWRRLEAAINYLGQEFIRLDQEPHLLPEVSRSDEKIVDVLEQHIKAMETAALRVRDLRQFISDSMNSLPDATLVATTDGHVLLANMHANDHFTSLGFTDVNGALLPYLFSDLIAPQPIDQTYDAKFDWWHLLDIKYIDALASGVSAQDKRGRDLLIKSGPSRSSTNVLTGWIVSIIDISTIRAAERSRDETLRFLSHDMRAPQASILALIELQNEPISALPLPELFSRIEKATRKTLGLADNFVQLARAESQEYRLEEVDFRDIVYDATDEMWSLAQSKKIEITTEIPDDDFPIKVDRSLMTRAIVNLISNAINYSPENTRVTCAIEHQLSFDEPRIICTVSDQGYGIAPADQIKVFQRFQRLELPHQPRQEGIGLGLVFIKTVIERHAGQISFSSKVGEGTVFTISLPCIEVAWTTLELPAASSDAPAGHAIAPENNKL